MRAAAAIAAVAALAAPVGGCDAVQSVAARAGVAGFEARCESSLPPARIEVVTAPVVYATDRTKSWRELTAMGGDATPTMRAVGLTSARVSDKVSLETAGIEDASTGRVCVRPSIKVELSAMPMTVYIGREIAGDECRAGAALAHERKHVAVYREELAHIATDVRAALRAAYGNRVLYYRSRAEAKRSTDASVSAELGPLLDRIAGQIKARQREIDSPEEYARVSAACGGMLAE
jgi:hypothetical protein